MNKSPKNIVIVCLKYAPGLFKEFCLIGDEVQRKSVVVNYIISEKYKDIAGSMGIKANYLTSSSNLLETMFELFLFPLRKMGLIDKFFRDNCPHVMYLYNAHPVNILFIKQAKKICPKIKIVYHLHEPYAPDKSFFRFWQKMVIIFQEALQKKTVAMSDHVVVPSPNAQKLFCDHYLDFIGSLHLAPLLIPDKQVRTRSRDYFLMLGHLYPDGRLDSFIEIVNYLAAKQIDIKVKFVTSSRISRDAFGKLNDDAKRVLEIVQKDSLSDEEISEYMANAFALICLHTRGAQSGTTPVAFMNGTPIIARDIPMFNQFIKDKINGKLVMPNAKPEDWCEAINYAKNNIATLSKNSRQSYLEIFHESKLGEYYQWLLNILENESRED
ncbi:MAG: hypothetical protein NT099_07105 [Candidatus Saganbacteria bacterium]|nr:hypothetical protein [Candidatus Saganbacteria bacterium]